VTEHKVIGKILGNRYRILRELGSGGMAWVYLAEDINEGRLVAIKVLYPQFGEDLAYIQRFHREAKLASTLSDPHVVRVLDYGATRDVHYLVMEYIEGQTLRDVIDERSSMPWREALHILDQLAEALEHAHLHGVVHRDIKPQNLMLTEAGTLKVLDFGIARARMLPSLTQSGFVGSPYYISPEQAMGEDVDIRSDVYSGGVVLYEMLSGRVPYDATSPWSIISQHIASEPPRVNLRSGEMPAGCQTLLNRMIAKRPEDRFQTPAALREAIACVLEGRPLPEVLDAEAPMVPNRVATAEGLYQRARQAVEEEDWQRAVDLLNQVVKLHPGHKDAADQLAQAGRQARLAALYAAACRAMESGRWQEVVDELSEVVAVQPRYRDAAELLERARAAQEKADAAQTVSGLYDKGFAHLRAREWEEAARCFRRVQQLSPGYKESASLLSEAERHLKTGLRWLPRVKITSSRRVMPLITLALILTFAVVGVYYFLARDSRASIERELATRVSEDPTPVYREAQAALQAGDWERAIQLLNALLASNPDSTEAAALREQAQAQRELAQTFEEGKAAYLAQDWSTAIDVLSRLRQSDADFRSSNVSDMLCDAYLNRGLSWIGKYEGAGSDTQPVEVGVQDLKVGSALCPDSELLGIQSTYANRLLLAAQAYAQDDRDTAIEELTSLVTDEPGYAEGSARQMLYTVLVERGGRRRESSDPQGALADYEQALALGASDTLDAATQRLELLEELNESGSPAQPTSTPAPYPYKYVAPLLVSPHNDAVHHGRYTQVMLKWEPVATLTEGEYYDVTVMHYVAGEPRYWGGAVKGTEWQVPIEAGVGEAANDRFFWWVTVRQAGTAPGPGELDKPVSPTSNTRTFYWGD
jgi:tetratricopeptide (TPR) repeat protein/predicted Ser/Thr protein kinase